MKFPGRRRHKHYFPVDSKDPLTNKLSDLPRNQSNYIVGIDQVVVDIEALVDDEFFQKYQLKKGMSQLVSDELAEDLYTTLQSNNLIRFEFAGGTIGNTLHNYSVLADDRSVLFGVMSEDIKIGGYAYRYVSNTSSHVDLNYLQGVNGPIGRCFTLIDSNGERTFAISPGHMDKLKPSSINSSIIEKSSALVISAYLMRARDGDTMTDATLEAVRIANSAKVPVILTLGTKFLIEEDPEWWKNFIKNHVTILAMNEEEAEALTECSSPLKAADLALSLADLVICTAGPKGMFIAGYVDEEHKRATEYALLPGDIPDFNAYEYSRPMLFSECKQPLKVYSHVAPYMGGPDSIKNTNGAGDGALAAILHDLAANDYHKNNVKSSSKHNQRALTYSSLSQMCKYANRVSYEVLAQHSPRLTKGLPEREDSLEQAYWSK